MVIPHARNLDPKWSIEPSRVHRRSVASPSAARIPVRSAVACASVVSVSIELGK
jgi:hypothetical protein